MTMPGLEWPWLGQLGCSSCGLTLHPEVNQTGGRIPRERKHTRSLEPYAQNWYSVMSGTFSWSKQITRPAQIQGVEK